MWCCRLLPRLEPLSRHTTNCPTVIVVSLIAVTFVADAAQPSLLLDPLILHDHVLGAAAAAATTLRFMCFKAGGFMVCIIQFTEILFE